MSKLAYSLAEQIKSRLNNLQPEIAIILGSGLGKFADQISSPIVIDYADVNGFPISTVSGHQGRLICGEISGKQVLCMQGRIHLYEGYHPTAIADIIKAYKLLGIKTLIVTNAAGSLKTEITPGSLMLIEDHINLSGFNPLIGPNDESFGPRFPGMDKIYNKQYLDIAKKIASENNIKISKGVYCMVSGPSFETPAEIRLYRTLGADANGMSTVPETMTAAYCGIKVIGISAITNYCTGIEGGSPSHEETLANAALCSDNMTLLVKKLIGEL